MKTKNPHCPQVVIAGTHSGVGKTTVFLALMATLTAKGRRVQPFKVGPDFLDPTHHRSATGRQSYNLDGWMLDAATNLKIFQKAASDADIFIIEGMMGLFTLSTKVAKHMSFSHNRFTPSKGK